MLAEDSAVTEVAFAAGPVKVEVSIFFHPQFHALRHRVVGDDLVFAKCLFSAVPFNPAGGKSGATFFITGDRQLLLKQVNSNEFKLFLERGRAFFHYWHRVHFHAMPSALAQLLGVFRVAYTRPKKQTRYFIVLKNLGHDLAQPKSFDLKGLGLKRRQEAEASVLWDQNFREWTNGRTLGLPKEDHHYIDTALWNDSTFLSSLQVVDYSLLVKVDTQSSEIVLGIIDYLQPYTWDKAAEHLIKSIAYNISKVTKE